MLETDLETAPTELDTQETVPLGAYVCPLPSPPESPPPSGIYAEGAEEGVSPENAKPSKSNAIKAAQEEAEQKRADNEQLEQSLAALRKTLWKECNEDPQTEEQDKQLPAETSNSQDDSQDNIKDLQDENDKDDSQEKLSDLQDENNEKKSEGGISFGSVPEHEVDLDSMATVGDLDSMPEEEPVLQMPSSPADSEAADSLPAFKPKGKGRAKASAKKAAKAAAKKTPAQSAGSAAGRKTKAQPKANAKAKAKAKAQAEPKAKAGRPKAKAGRPKAKAGRPKAKAGRMANQHKAAARKVKDETEKKMHSETCLQWIQLHNIKLVRNYQKSRYFFLGG